MSLSVSLTSFQIACENIRFSSLFVAKRPQRRRARRNGCFRRIVFEKAKLQSVLIRVCPSVLSFTYTFFSCFPCHQMPLFPGIQYIPGRRSPVGREFHVWSSCFSTSLLSAATLFNCLDTDLKQNACVSPSSIIFSSRLLVTFLILKN